MSIYKRKTSIFITISLLSCLVFILPSCRGNISKKPPIHLNPNMDTQPKYKPFRESNFFKDGRTMRPLIEGTIALGKLKDNSHFYNGTVNGAFVKEYPPQMILDTNSLKRGKEMFRRSCSHCHTMNGDGKSIVAKSLPVKPRTFHSIMSYERSVGEFYNIIVNGTGTMAPHRFHVKSEIDRWNIVSYIRALQLSKNKEAIKYFLESQKGSF